MKKLFDRLPSSRSLTKLFSILVFAAVAAPGLSFAHTTCTSPTFNGYCLANHGSPQKTCRKSGVTDKFVHCDKTCSAAGSGFTQVANSCPTGSTSGGTTGSFKTVFNNRDLQCDLDDLRSTAILEWDTAIPYFRFGAFPAGNPNPLVSIVPDNAADGAMVCFEIDPGTQTQVSPVGLFTLIQARSENGLEVSVCNQGDNSCADGGPPPVASVTKRTTFVFKVLQGGSRDENLLWRLVPADQATRDIFCKDQNGNIIPQANCAANFGLDEHNKATFTNGIPDGGGKNGESAGDYPARDVSGDSVIDLAKGEIFRFKTETEGGNEIARTLLWGPCHSGQFNLSVRPACLFGSGPSAKETRATGEIEGGLIVQIDVSPTLNVDNTTGTAPVTIFGSETVHVSTATCCTTGVLNFNTTQVFVNGTAVSVEGFSEVVNTDFNDLRLNLGRAGLTAAVRPCNDGPATLLVAGTLTDGTPWEGSDVVVLNGCAP